MDHQAMNKVAYEAGFQIYIDTVPPVQGEFQAWLDKVLSFISTDEIIFEIGSGSGKDGDYIRSKGYQVFESDFIDSFVTHLKARSNKVYKLDILNEEIPPGHYKMILANAVLLHFNIEEMSKIIQKINATLPVGGYFVVGLKHGEGEGISTHKFDLPRYFKYWSQEEIVTFLNKFDFQVLDITFVENQKWINIVAQKLSK
jgi:hypothetical protein